MPAAVANRTNLNQCTVLWPSDEGHKPNHVDPTVMLFCLLQ